MGYIPDRGDAIGLNVDFWAGHEQARHEQAGHEQAGHRPALVISPASYNEAAGLALVGPSTNTVGRY